MKLWTLAAMVAFVLVVVAPEANGGAGTPITTCGQVVTTNAYLTQNLHCTASDGIVVAADKITIDLKGFRLRGDRSFGHYGIDDNGFDGVTVKNGTVRNFFIGVHAYAGANQVSISDVVASGNAAYGVEVAGDSAKIKTVTVSGNASVGFYVVGESAAFQSAIATGNTDYGFEITGNSASVKSSTAAGNRYGILVVGAEAKIQSSSASGNGGDFGIAVNGNAATLKSNKADGNGFDGGASDLFGLGISVIAPTTAPTGTNDAQGNDDTAECSPALLC
jgi:Right handed beta helix region